MNNKELRKVQSLLEKCKHCWKNASIAFSQGQLLIDKVLTQRKLGSRIVQLILALLALNHFAQVFQGITIF